MVLRDVLDSRFAAPSFLFQLIPDIISGLPDAALEQGWFVISAFIPTSLSFAPNSNTRRNIVVKLQNLQYGTVRCLQIINIQNDPTFGLITVVAELIFLLALSTNGHSESLPYSLIAAG